MLNPRQSKTGFDLVTFSYCNFHIAIQMKNIQKAVVTVCLHMQVILFSSVSPFVPKRSITPIPEEVDQEEGKASSNGSTQENDKSSANGSVKTLSMIEEDLGKNIESITIGS